MPTYVNATGPTYAEIAFVGEAPGAEEDRLGIPFIGPAGKFLDILLRKAGINREDTYVTNVVKIRPPANNLKRLEEVGDPLGVWEESLRKELHSLPNAKVIIPLGDVAFHAITGLRGVSKWRGSILRWENKYIVPTIHPSAVLQYSYKLHPVVVNDLIKARTLLVRGYHPKDRQMIIEPSFQASCDYLDSLLKVDAFAWDIETFGNQIACIGFARSEIDSMCIPFKNGFANYFDENQEFIIWEKIGKVMQSTDVIKIGHNAFRFDNEFIRRIYGNQPNHPHFDTLLAHQLVSPDHPHALHFLTSIYTDLNYYKDDVKEEGERSFSSVRTFTNSNYFPTLWTYNCKDCLATYECYKELTKELKQLDMYDLFCGYVMPLYEVLFEIQNVGCRINLSEFDRMRELYEKESEEISKDIEQSFGKININSPKQLMALLYERIGLPTLFNIDKKTGLRTPTVDDDALAALLRRLDIGTLNEKSINYSTDAVKSLLIKLRRSRYLNKISGTYLQRKALDEDNKLRTSYGVTETGRLASKQRLDKKGMNVQNIPPEVRVVFEAEDGWTLLEGDLAQAEARVVAFLAGCQPLIDEFNRPGGDVFRFIGQWIFNKPPAQITKEERQLCKTVVHGSHYGMGSKTFSQRLNLPVSEAMKIQDKYFKAFPEIKLWQKKVEDTLKKTRRLKTPYGRVRTFFGRLPNASGDGYDTFKEALAYVPQSVVGDTLNQGLLKLYYLLKSVDAEIWLQVHDSILIHVKESHFVDVVKMMVEHLSKKILIEGKVLQIPIEIKAGKTWGTMSPLTISSVMNSTSSNI